MDWFGTGGNQPRRDHEREYGRGYGGYNQPTYQPMYDDAQTSEIPPVPSTPPASPPAPPPPFRPAPGPIAGPGPGPAPGPIGGPIGGPAAGPVGPPRPQPVGGRRRAAQAPVSRLGSAAVAGVALLATAVLAGGALGGRPALAAACLLVQVAFVLTWAFGAPRSGAVVSAVVGIGAAVAADLLALFDPEISLGAFGYAVAGGFMAAVGGQLFRGAGRQQVTDGLGTAMVGVIGAVALPALLVLSRHADGVAALRTCLPAAGAALLVARLADVALPAPRVTPQVPRGLVGVVLGGVLVGPVAGYLAGVNSDLDGLWAAGAGLVVGVAAVLTDLGVSFGTAGLPSRTNQNQAEAPGPLEPPGWASRYLLGPLTALAVIAPIAYVLGVLILLQG